MGTLILYHGVVKLSMSISDQLKFNGYVPMIEDNELFAIRSADIPHVSWDEILNILNDDILTDNVTPKTRMNEYGFRVVAPTRIKDIRRVADDLESMFEPNDRGIDHELYISLTTQKEAYGGLIHKDEENVLFWGLRGISNWTIFDEDDNAIKSIDIYPGDIIYCPAGVKHRVVAIKPRAGVSFSLGKLKEQF